MSGTSLDGVDAVLLELEGSEPAALTWRLRAFVTIPYGEERRSGIAQAIESGDASSLCRLHADLGEWLAEGALAVCAAARLKPEEVAAIGSHGQTVWHEPPTAGRRGATLQLGDPATIAERSGVRVIADFRARDVAAGGHGAPLVPWADSVLFAGHGRRRAIQNIGGMANVTWLPPRGSDLPVFAFDTGPGVALVDAAAARATGGRMHYDEEGRLAAAGRVREDLLLELLAHPFFQLEPPRSTGRETFGTPFVRRLIERVAPNGEGQWADLLATLTALTARSVADAYRRWVLPHGVDEIYVAGGGARNPTLMGMLAAELAPVPVRRLDELGMDSDAREAAAFALLAWAHLLGLPANVPAATGAAGPRILGSLSPGAAPPRG
ncbi:MAG: anhydro-N-acetylmuramic acid kinase [Gemmatimonadetes bacterium]|nr:anhydro-N-acetylmuramic acid kinase [Gemmatimonadota bacterium]